LEGDRLEERLRMLAHWGAVEQEHDAGLARTAAEWRRNRYTYDVSPGGRLTEELLMRLDALGEEIGRLDRGRLPAIRDALARLVESLEGEHSDGGQLRALFEKLLREVEALHAGALAFMRSLGELMRTVEQVSEEEFDRGKAALLEHLQGFRRSRMHHSAELLELIERIEGRGADELVRRIVAAEEFVALPGGATVAEQRARRQQDLLERWSGLRSWFVSTDSASSPWHALNEQVVDAIRAVLAIAERLIERRSQRIDRAAVLLHLAGRVAQAPPGEATAWLRAALGIRSPRHVGVPEGDHEQVVARGRTSWLESPPAPVIAHLRTPGARKPGTGRGSRVADLSAARRVVLEKRLAERRELERLLAQLASRGRFRLSSLQHVEPAEFAHLLDWIGRAYETPAGPGGMRRADSLDGRATILLHPPADPVRRRARLRVTHGTLELPDFGLEVKRR
jgi:uncharacterized protein (TIGR02677 family)